MSIEEGLVLIVDDNEMNRKLAVALLKPYGVKADVAESGVQALEKIKSTPYDLIFMDYLMPEMDGAETTIHLRGMDEAYFREVPIIALTADDREEVTDILLQAGMNGILRKPIDVSQLKMVLEEWIPTALHGQKECVKKDAVDNILEDLAEFQELRVAGIDPGEGIKNCGSRDFYRSMLGDFYRLIDLKSVLLVKSLATKEIRTYTIEVHALKNCARLIGALELSEDFANLEKLGNSDNIEGVKVGTKKVLAMMQKLKGVLKVYGDSENHPQREVSREKILECLHAIEDAVEAFDIDSVDAAAKELEGYRLPESCKKSVEMLKAYIADVALEDILETTRELIKKIEEAE